MVLGSGNINAKALLLGEAPGRIEMKYGEPFIGPAGGVLEFILVKARLSRKTDIFLDNVIKTLPEEYGYGSNKPTPKEIERDRPLLLETLNKMKPRYIVALGATAIEWCKGKNTYVFVGQEVGNTFKADFLDFEHTVIPTYHPSGILRSDDWANYGELYGALSYISFATKVKTEEMTKSIKGETVAENKLEQAFEEIEKAYMIVIDVEVATTGEMLGIGVAVSAYRAFYFPWKVLGMFGYELNPYYTDKFDRLKEFMRKLISSNKPKGGHYFKFDMHHLENNLDTKFNGFEYDSLDMARLAYNNFQNRRLDSLVKWLRPIYAGWKVDVKMGVGKGNIKWEDLKLPIISEYCCLDAAHTYFLIELFRYLM